MRKIKFQNNQYYHIYNRGVDKQDVFLAEENFDRFIESMIEFNQFELVGSIYKLRRAEPGSVLRGGTRFRPNKPLVEIICYCLNPNHYHLILRQCDDNGISKYMHKLGLGYTNYLNLKNKRCGPLFQGKYKAKHIDSDKYLFMLSTYIHGNPEIHGYISKAEDYEWSSYKEYLGLIYNNFCHKEIIMNHINSEEYKKIVKENIQYTMQKKFG